MNLEFECSVGPIRKSKLQDGDEGEGEEDDANKDFVRERIQKAAKAGGLAWEPAKLLLKKENTQTA